MKSPGLAVFVLFFGLSLLDALWNPNWIAAGFWLACGLGFWVLDRRVWNRPVTRADQRRG
jgi:hypothetical protein